MAGALRDEREADSSSSGGAFGAIVRSVVEQWGSDGGSVWVCGAAFEGHFQVRHQVVRWNGPECLIPFLKSKYVHSDTRGAMRKLRRLLADERNRVVFSGAPCQVAGLRNLVPLAGDRLFCVDLVCQGAPSQRVFDRYVEGEERRQGSRLGSYTFRNKEILDNGTKYSRSARLEFLDGTVRRVTRFNDDYLKLFYNPAGPYRPSCEKCAFKCAERVGDATIGDAWGVREDIPELDPIKGASLVLFNSDAALEIAPRVGELMNLHEWPLERAIAGNGALGRPQPPSKGRGEVREQFCRDIRERRNTFRECVEEYLAAAGKEE